MLKKEIVRDNVRESTNSKSMAVATLQSVATNRKELHAEFSFILLVSPGLCKLKHYE